MGISLPVLWFLIIGFALMMYVVMDGFDLGIGILFPFVRTRGERDAMVNSVAPVWDGNETWLVFGGAAMFAAFPLAYGFLFSAIYIPLVVMLLGLIWRGVSFEFRFRADETKKAFWDKAFACGSYVAGFAQGVSLGTFLNGFHMTSLDQMPNALECFTPFSMFTGVGVVVAYALLGATWLVMKTDGPLQSRMRKLAQCAAGGVLLTIALVSVWTPLTHAQVATRWFVVPNILFFAPVPILVLLASWGLQRTLKATNVHAAPFSLALLLIFLGYTGLVISVWPEIIPWQMSIWQAAAPPQSMGFALVGALSVIPFILVYTSWAYYVFRGKVQVGEAYH